MDDGDNILVVAEDPSGVAVKAVFEVVVTEKFPVVEKGVVGGKALVEPEMAPVAAGDEVAEPLVGDFMGIEATAAPEVLGSVGEEGPGGQGGQAGVFHAPPHVVDGTGVVILVPGVGDPDLPFEVVEDLDGVAEGVGELVFLGGRHVKGHGELPVFVLHLNKVAGKEGDEVVNVDLVLEPVECHEARVLVLLLGEETSVGEGLHALRDAADHLGSELFVGVVVAGEPVLMVLGFTLGPELGIAGRVSHFGGAEVETLLRSGVVGDGDAGVFPGRDGIPEGDLKVGVGGLGSLNGMGGGDLPDVQAGSVEVPLLEGLGDRSEVENCGGVEGALLKVGGDVDFEVCDIHEAIRGVAVLGRLALFCGGELAGMKPGHHGAVTALEEVSFVGAEGKGAEELAAKNGQSDEQLSVHDVRGAGRCPL